METAAAPARIYSAAWRRLASLRRLSTERTRASARLRNAGLLALANDRSASIG